MWRPEAGSKQRDHATLDPARCPLYMERDSTVAGLLCSGRPRLFRLL